MNEWFHLLMINNHMPFDTPERADRRQSKQKDSRNTVHDLGLVFICARSDSVSLAPKLLVTSFPSLPSRVLESTCYL